MKNVRPSSLDLQYRIWHAGAYIDPRAALADLDRYFKLAFFDPDFEPDGGLLVTCDGEPWNSHEYFDTAYNLTTWFEAARYLASGERTSADVWDWEESRCKITLVGEDLLRLEEPPFLPPVVVGFQDFLKKLLAPGALFLELQRAAAARLEELCAGVEESDVPAIAHEWARELPEDYLAERIVSRSGPLVEVQGWSLAHRWENVSGIPLPDDDLDQLEACLAALARLVETGVRYPGTGPDRG